MRPGLTAAHAVGHSLGLLPGSFIGLVLALAVAGSATPALGAPLALQPCRLDGLATEALCGVLPRPLDPGRPEAGRFDLHVAVVPAVARHKRPDPVVFLAGGPGQSAIELAGPLSAKLARLLNRRDLVLVDQRGTGSSLALACDGDRGNGAPRPLAVELDAEHRVAELARCREQLSARVGDLRWFTTPLAAADLDAVREALGVAQWNVIGASYGTRLALELMRQSPGSVRRAVLDGVVPPDMALPRAATLDQQAALDAVWAACEAETACRQRHPALRAQWRALLDGLPRPVDVPHPRTGIVETVPMTRERVLGLVRPALYSPPLASALPAAVSAAARGHWAPLVGLGSALGAGREAGIASGLHFAVACSEDEGVAVPGGEPPRNDFSDSLDLMYRRVCRDWPRATLPAGFRDVPPAAAPVLALSGGIDPVTPPRHAERVVGALGPMARHVVVPQASHGTMAIPCLRDAVFRFIDAATPGQAMLVDVGCATSLPRPAAFVPPGDVGHLGSGR
jgi:pimeloyl-ACP methyl ester carboxylesterase